MCVCVLDSVRCAWCWNLVPLSPGKVFLGFSYLARQWQVFCRPHTQEQGCLSHMQMLNCGRYSFSSIRLFLGKAFRQSKENSPGEAAGPALWLALAWLVPASRSDLGSVATDFPAGFVFVFHF